MACIRLGKLFLDELSYLQTCKLAICLCAEACWDTDSKSRRLAGLIIQIGGEYLLEHVDVLFEWINVYMEDLSILFWSGM